MNNYRLTVICALIFLVSGTGCNKEEENYDFSLSQVVAAYHTLVIDALPNVMRVQAFINDADTLPFCGQVIYKAGDTAAFPNHNDTVIYQIKFDTGCVDYDGRYKTGSMRYFFYPGGSNYNYLVSFDDVVVKGYRLKGSVLIKEEPFNHYDFKLQSYSFNVDQVSGDNDITIDLSARADYAGLGTDLYLNLDDVRGRDFEDNTFRVARTSDLLKKHSCEYIADGVLEIKPNGLNWRTLDFASSQCSASVKVEAGSTTLRFNAP